MRRYIAALVLLTSSVAFAQSGSNPELARKLGQDGVKAADAGDFTRALLLFDQARSLDPDNPAYSYEMAYVQYLQKKYGSVIELVEPLLERLAAVDDVVPVIMEAALDTRRSSALCRATLALFAAILAAQAGNAALNVLATGGVYLGGGMPRRMLPFLDAPEFLARFRAKGRMSALLGRMPLHVITAHKVALLGAAHAGLDDASG